MRSMVLLYAVAISNFTQLGSDLFGEATGDASGSSVSISADGSTLIVGATGSVRVYQRNPMDNGYTQIGSDIDGETAGDFFGQSVSISGDGFGCTLQ